MADSPAVSSDESLKDWTLVDEGPEQAPRASRSSSTSSISAEEITIESLEKAHKGGATPSLTVEQTAAAIGKDGTCDSDLDFVRIEDENDDQLNDWVTPAVAEHRMDTSQHEHEDANGDWSSECTEADSDEESTCESDEEEDSQDSEELETDTAFPMNEELPADYPLHYGPSRHMYTHRRNTQVNEWLTTALCIVLAVVSGVAIGHFFGSETLPHDHHDEPVPRHTAFLHPDERPASTALSDVQKGQVEILKQLQEMIRAQSDLKQRVAVLEDENQDLRYRLLENRKRCTRILHKPSAVTSADSRVSLNYSSIAPLPVQRLHLRLPKPTRLRQLLLHQKRDVSAESPTSTKTAANLPLTISAVVVPPKRDNNVIATRFSPLESLHSPPVAVPSTHFIGLPFPRFEPYYYPFLDLETLARAAGVNNPESSPDDADLNPSFVLIDSNVIPLQDLVNERKHKAVTSLAAPSAILNPYNFSFESGYQQRPADLPNRQEIKLIKVKDMYPEKHVSNGNVKRNDSSSKWAKGKGTITDIKKVIKSEKERIKENRKKFDEEYAEFKARWKNTSNENHSRKEGKLRDKEGCKKGKLVDECEEGYCYTRQQKKYYKYERKEAGKKFWDSLPAIVRKHLEKSAKMERILKGFGTDIVNSRIFQKVVEEIPARLKMSSEWWDCQWKWWQNFARNRHASSYGDCAGYLTSWQNRQKQNNARNKDQERKFSTVRRTKNSVADRWNEEERDDSSNWYAKRVSGREYQRQTHTPEYGPGAWDWTFVRASLREKERSQRKQPKSWRPTNSSWWFFQRARNRDARRQLHYSNAMDGDIYQNAIPGDPIYAFLKDRAVWYGSHHP